MSKFSIGDFLPAFRNRLAANQSPPHGKGQSANVPRPTFARFRPTQVTCTILSSQVLLNIEYVSYSATIFSLNIFAVLLPIQS